MVIVKQIAAASLAAMVCLTLHAGALPARAAGDNSLMGAAPATGALPVYKVGDKAPRDIVAAVPFDVVDAQATAALKVSRAHEIAAIYHQVRGQTNRVAIDFLAAFAGAHRNFRNAVAAAYGQPSIDNSILEASNFGYLVTAYNAKHTAFPVTTELAVAWARGGSGEALRDKWLGFLLQAMDTPIQPGPVPAHFVFWKKVRIMPVASRNEKFTFTRAWRLGHIISLDKIPAISAARATFRRKFSQQEQPMADALARFLRPDCFPDVALTEQARDYSVRNLQVSDHFDVGQIIVHRGARIGQQAQAALAAMAQAMIPAALDRQIAAEQDRARQEHELAQAEQQQAQIAQQAARLAQQQQQQAQADQALAQSQADQERQQAAAMRAQELEAQMQVQTARTRDAWLIAALAVVSILALLIPGWLLRRRRKTAQPMTLSIVEKTREPNASELAPYLAQTLKEAVVQGLAVQRAELLEAQRVAAAEIAELVHRLDRLQAPMQERIRAYQERIQELQKELADRTEENRELLKMKIEMVRRQIETERGSVRFN